jgi:hypothetical protein
VRAAVVSLAFAALLPAQSLRVYSEFQRIDPFGNVVAADRGERSREILSPAVARNAYASFHVAATVGPNRPAFLYVQQKPEWLRIQLYREHFVKARDGWVPDPLAPVKLPCYILLPDDVALAGQTTAVYWMDLFVPEGTPAQRMRLEILLNLGDRWITYPMEIRVRPAVAPPQRWKPGRVAPLTARADAGICTAGALAEGLTVRHLIRRNAFQDATIAGSAGWCGQRHADPEWFLDLRKQLYK